MSDNQTEAQAGIETTDGSCLPNNQQSSSEASVTDLNEICKYKMDYQEKGLCVIINMENFSRELQGNCKKRVGTNKDADSLKIIFETIGFKVQIEKDKTCSEIFEILKKAAKEDHSQRSCFVCVVMSHGNENGFYAYDDIIKEERVMQLFNGKNCRSLLGKPKLFFIQSCRGDEYDAGVALYNGSDKSASSTIPIEADFLCHYSTPPGYISFRKTEDGTWFIQSLCQSLEQYWKTYEIMHILTFVNYKVANEYVVNGKKQIPCIVSKLTKLLYLSQPNINIAS
ncbi:caspase-3-like [Mixophyes fleayi]|uniref:caspase-3-like n=1 Tax=Mixophyes fleayi TaxID=3061075 RepID=UPI003F4D801B